MTRSHTGAMKAVGLVPPPKLAIEAYIPYSFCEPTLLAKALKPGYQVYNNKDRMCYVICREDEE